jgi:hypothetical protein
MRKTLQILLTILLVPVFLVVFTIIHELGHTILARLLGDPNSIFYLVRIKADSACFGCNIYDQSKLSWGANLVVSLGGLLATQLTAIFCLYLLRLRNLNLLWQRIISAIALGFAFLDVPVQVIQGLLYNLSQHTWPTNVDLMDFMLLLQEKTSASQLWLKGFVFIVAAFYLTAFVWVYRRHRKLERTRDIVLQGGTTSVIS